MEQKQQGMMQALVGAGVTVMLGLVGNLASADVIQDSLSFSSQDQSMWGPGQAIQFNEPGKFYGAEWTHAETRDSVGGFLGGNTQVLNPLWVAWKACPFLCGGEPTKYFNVDTSTGLEVSASTAGRIGFELGATFDSGSIDTLVSYNTQVDIPDPRDLPANTPIALNTSSSLTGDSIASQFPTASAHLGVVMEVSANFAATGCLVGACDTASFGTGTLGGTQELISFNEDGQGGIEYFGGSGFLSDALDTAVALGLVDLPTGFPATLDIPPPAGLGRLGSITAHLPQPNTSGGLDATGTKLTSQGQDDLLDISLDVDNILSVGLTGVGGLFGGSADMGLGFGVSYDLINVELGPQIDLVQSFEFTPTLVVDLQFSKPVDVTGFGLVTSASGLQWDSLPTMAFGRGLTEIIPTFYLGTMLGGNLVRNAGELLNRLLLDIDGNIRVDLLTATFNTPFGSESIGIGNLINETFDLFTTPAFFSKTFAMGGFTPMVGTAFAVVVSEPGTLLIFGSGLIVMGWVGRRRRRMPEQ